MAYDAKSVVVLEGLEPVRKRPAMYIGTTSLDGVHHCLNEIIDNSIDEALAGYATSIVIKIMDNGYLTVIDDGRGIPVDIMPQYNKSALEIILTKLHAGAKFDAKAYKVSGGLHGVGSSVVNALSSHLVVEVKRDGKVYSQEYSKGKPITEVKIISKSTLGLESESGTAITFIPDTEIFKENTELEIKKVLKQVKERAYLTPGVLFKVFDNRTGAKSGYFFEGGITSLVEELNTSKEVLHPVIYFKDHKEDVEVEIAVQYTDYIKDNIMSYVNVINTKEGGTHETGFKSALTKIINDYGNKENILKKGNISGDDAKDGLTAIVYIKMPSTNLQFEGQTKTKLGNAEVQSAVYTIVKNHLQRYFEEHPANAQSIMQKVLVTQQARLAAKAARDSVIRKSALEGAALPGKLADCREKDPAKSELFIVEGDSAGGSAKQGRDRKIQAILPLRGKVLNSEKSYLDKIMAFRELRDLVIALGTGISDLFDYKKLRYHKIVIMTDADVDGEHIMTLILTFFFRHLPQLIENGHMYVAQPPLYKLYAGKKIFYAYNDSEMKKIIAENFNGNYNLQRYKGLGEMNPEQLWETTMNPDNRILKQINIEDAEEADKVFSMLMGEKVPPRKKFIQTHAKSANLDI
jgi:DNA gyrase subunit B